MKNNETVVVLSTNSEYVLYCFVTIHSIICNSDRNKKYSIYVFERDLEHSYISLLEEQSNEHICIRCIDILDYINTKDLRGYGYLSIETYYRLYIPVILPQYDKVLYIDSDTCVLTDISELFFSDLCGKIIGAIRDVPTIGVSLHCERIGGLNLGSFFNAGVLLIDTKQFEKTKIREKCLELLKTDSYRNNKLYTWADNDVLNIVLQDKIKFLDDRWNCQVQYLDRLQVVFEESRGTYLKNIKNAKILHFAGAVKLWFYPQYDQAKIFWKYAKDTPVFFELLKRSIEKARTMTFERYHFPYDIISYGSRIVLYGAGKVGQMFYQQLQLTQYADVVLWVDKSWGNIDSGLNIVSPDRIRETVYDYVLLAIDRENIAKSAMESLYNYGISRDKLIWKQYGS